MQRHLTSDEKRLTSALLARAVQVEVSPEWLDQVKVSQMNDGGMGSLRFHLSEHSRMGKQAAELRFRDADGIDVIASLNLDESGRPFELDIWKVNFDPLIKIPDRF